MNMGIVCILIALAVVHVTTASMVNEALRKPTSMSSSKSGYSASTAVDGNTDAGGYGANKIIETGTGHPFAWWKVDLQREVQDATVRIYFRTPYKRRRNGVKLYTSTNPFPELNPTSLGQLCHTVTGDPSGSDIPYVYNVTCTGRWRYLLLYTDTDNDGYGPVLDFGEVQVFACSGGTYGEDCTKICSSRNCVNMVTCDGDGSCLDGCKPGWSGVDCTQACDSGSYGPGCSSSCINRNCVEPSTECDHVTGQCRYGCTPGYKGIDCVEKCESGTYGNCSMHCTERNCLVQSAECNHVTGQCEGGCQAGYRGNHCEQACNLGINYGVNCIKSCTDRHCNQQSSECDTRTGQCIAGCQVGWTGVDCTSFCSMDTYGPDCTEKCGKCDGVCDSVDGRCPSGCLDGYNGTKCDVALKADASIKQPVYFGVASLAGAVVGTFIAVVLLAVGIHLCLTRQGRIQWIKTSEDKKQVRQSRDLTQMSSISPRPTETSEHAQSSIHVYNNDYAVLDIGTKTDKKDYDVIKPNYYQNI